MRWVGKIRWSRRDSNPRQSRCQSRPGDHPAPLLSSQFVLSKLGSYSCRAYFFYTSRKPSGVFIGLRVFKGVGFTLKSGYLPRPHKKEGMAHKISPHFPRFFHPIFVPVPTAH